MTKHNYFLLVLVFALLTFMACGEGPEGLAGPQGEQGLQGEPGEQGEKGTPGEKGDPGNANIRIETFVLNENMFTNSEDLFLALESAVLLPSILTEDIVKDGAVLGYYDLGSNGQSWTPLPYRINNYEFIFGYETNYAEFVILRRPGMNALASELNGHQIRFLAFVPDNIMWLDDVDTNDYNAVMEAVRQNQVPQ